MGRILLACVLKLAIITGASTGIGAASAAAFLQAGFQMINLARRPSRMADVTNLTVDLAMAFEEGRIESLLPDQVQSASQLYWSITLLRLPLARCGHLGCTATGGFSARFADA